MAASTCTSRLGRTTVGECTCKCMCAVALIHHGSGGTSTKAVTVYVYENKLSMIIRNSLLDRLLPDCRGHDYGVIRSDSQTALFTKTAFPPVRPRSPNTQRPAARGADNLVYGPSHEISRIRKKRFCQMIPAHHRLRLDSHLYTPRAGHFSTEEHHTFAPPQHLLVYSSRGLLGCKRSVQICDTA